MTPDTALQPYDFEAAAIREDGITLATQAEALVISDDETDVGAKTVLAIVTKGLKAAEARRVELKAPALAECQAIDTAFGDATAPFETAKALIGTKAGEYFKAKKDAEEAARREAERIEREAMAVRVKAEAEAEAEAFEAAWRGEKPAPTPEPVEVVPVAPIPVTQATTKTWAGTVGMVKKRSYRVVDEAKIPHEFWLLDGARIAKVYAAGDDVPGCEEDITYSPRTH